MSFEVQIVSGKPEIRKAPAGLVRSQVEEQKVEDRQVSLADLVHSIIEPLRVGLEAESEIEISITGSVSVESKDDKKVLTFDVGGDSPPQGRTMGVKIKTTIQPK